MNEPACCQQRYREASPDESDLGLVAICVSGSDDVMVYRRFDLFVTYKPEFFGQVENAERLLRRHVDNAVVNVSSCGECKKREKGGYFMDIGRFELTSRDDGK